MPQLDPTWYASQIFWLLVTFVTLYFVLARWALPKMMAVLTQRADTLAFDMGRARDYAADAERAKSEYERALGEARERSQHMFAEAVATQKVKAEQSAKDMDARIAQKLSEAEKMINARKQQLLEELKPVSEELATMIVDKLASASSNGDSAHGANENVKSRRG